jgi:hypothetical protein
MATSGHGVEASKLLRARWRGALQSKFDSSVEGLVAMLSA